jgi:glutathionyl-hydroquinone reductase
MKTTSSDIRNWPADYSIHRNEVYSEKTKCFLRKIDDYQFYNGDGLRSFIREIKCEVETNGLD